MPNQSMPKAISNPESFMTIRSAKNSLLHITIGDWVDSVGRGNISVSNHECLEQIGNRLNGNLRYEFRLMMCIQTVIDVYM